MAEALDPYSHFSEDLSSELEALRAIFVGEGEFKVEELPRDGDYCCVVQVQPEGLAVGLQFSLPETYPETGPKIEIVPNDKGVLNDGPLLTELLQLLYQSAQEFAGEPVMYTLVDAAKEWLEGRSIRREEEDEGSHSDGEQEESVDGELVTRSHKNKKKSKKLDFDEEEDRKVKGKQKKKKQPVEDDLGPGKKSRMKTASEVISRIQWDKQVRQEDFIIGYLDRFKGVIEKPFTAFSWVDIATVDDYVTLTIPRHRIQYFKYKDQVVWDKNERLDDIFGSTGSNKTILDTVEMFEKENQNTEEKEACDAVENEERMEITEESQQEHATLQTERRQRPSRSANYFFAIRITDPVIRRCVQRIQNAVCDDEPRLENWRTDTARLHLTLCTMRLDGQEDMSKAMQVLKVLQGDISSLLSPVTMLRFQGLDQFHGRILYSAPEESPALAKLSQMLQVGLAEAGINLAGNRPEFSPHMTLLKVDRRATDAFDNTPIRLDHYQQFSQAFIGVQPIDTIHLCSMMDPPRPDGFYYCLGSMDIQSEHSI
ncbi:uncharacterized protein LOC110990718 [Acanthaster planci]|uniref:Uncharacterized protein LOC110990718 n=1 Tax=Acanthaster planci TaxID=133434 RepID=A0A8B8A6A2_ACAPL|nr:uncharacterized protein LOC110990718 [Acanthaster planci]